MAGFPDQRAKFPWPDECKRSLYFLILLMVALRLVLLKRGQVATLSTLAPFPVNTDASSSPGKDS